MCSLEISGFPGDFDKSYELYASEFPLSQHIDHFEPGEYFIAASKMDKYSWGQSIHVLEVTFCSDLRLSYL
jgi:hypothetical protein